MLGRVIAKRLKGTLIVVHRWLGVPLSLFFALWFPSAIGMMYWDFPAVTPEDRLAHAAPIDSASIAIAPDEAWRRLGTGGNPEDIRLNTFDGRPVYRFRTGRGEGVVFADTGDVRGHATPATRRRVAARWTGRPDDEARIDEVTAVDQWTVQGALRTVRPLWKFSFADGQQVYVAESTGEVVQATTRASRVGAYLGPIPHWLYFTPLRQRQELWRAVVIWSSGIATIAAALGLTIAVWTAAPIGRIPYRGQKRWHTIFGLIFGVGAVTWAFSGLLSMDPFPAPREETTHVSLRDRVEINAFTRRRPREAVEILAPLRVKQIEWVSVVGEPSYLATLEDGSTRIVPTNGAPRERFDVDRLSAALSVDGATVFAQERYDAHYLDRHHRKPLPVLHVVTSGSDVYVDLSTARIVGVYDARRDWTKRWLYHALHSLDLPWLYDHRPLWDAIVVGFMVGGTALSVTSLMLTWRVVRGFRQAPPTRR